MTTGLLQLKLADFGLACRIQSDDSLLYHLCGTPTYVAPEVGVSKESNKQLIPILHHLGAR